MEYGQEVSTRQIQEKMLEILIYFGEFCKENNLGYVLAGGSCLGAVRHKGFIPWDDDVDVLMLREDFEKLQDLWAKNADTEKYSCMRSDEHINIHHSAIEIRDNNTTFITKHSVDSDINHGVVIDIIPLDGVPESKFRQIWQMINSMMFCCFNFQRLPEHKGKLTYCATKIALGVIRSSKLRHMLWKGAEKRMSKYKTSESKYVSSFGEGTSIMRQRFLKEWFVNVSYLEFEGHLMPVPGNYDEYLKISYGDYMQLPPEEDRVPRHTVVAVDLENSYKKYKGIYYCVEK